MTAPYNPTPWQSGPASDEYFRQLNAFNAQRDTFMQNLRMGTQVVQQQPVQQPLLNTVPQAQTQQEQLPPWGDRDLMGAARFWGIPEDVAQAMPRHVLQAQVAMLRQGAQPDEDTFGNRIMAMASVPGMLGVGMAEGLMNMATSIPILGPALRRQQGVRQIDSYIRSLEEGFRASTPENFQGVLTGENVAGHIASLWHPGAAAWGLAGRGLTWVGNPIVRGALQGGASSYLLEGGGDHPGAAVAVGAALGPLAPLIGPAVDKIAKRFVSPQMFESVEQELSHNVSPIMGVQAGTASDIALGRSLQMAAQAGDESAGALLESLQASGQVPRNLVSVRNPSFRSPGIPTAQAEGLATQLNKVETIVGSSELPRIAQQTQPTDVSVMEAAMVTNPGGTNIVEGIVDPAEFIRAYSGTRYTGQNLRIGAVDNEMNQLGPAIYATDNPAVAESYAMIPHTEMARRGPANVRDLRITPKQIFDFDQAADPALVAEANAQFGLNLSPVETSNQQLYQAMGRATGGKGVFGEPKGTAQANEFLRTKGYDVISRGVSEVHQNIGVGPVSHREYAVLDPASMQQTGQRKLTQMPNTAQYQEFARGVRAADEADAAANAIDEGGLGPQADAFVKSFAQKHGVAVADLYDQVPGALGQIPGGGATKYALDTSPHLSFVQRKGRLAAMMSDQPITREMVDSFERHGFYPSQKAIHTDQGKEVVIQSISPGGIATVRPLYGDASYTVLTKSLSGATSSPGVTAVPHLWDEMNTYADMQTMQVQHAMGGGLSPQQFETIRSQQLPQHIEDFLDLKEIQGVGSRARIKQYFNERYVQSFLPEAPAEAAWAHSVQQEAATTAQVHQASPVQDLDAAADSKGFLAVPNAHGGWSLVNRMAGPDGGVAGVGLDFANEEAAMTWLQKYNRDMPDITPSSTVPTELGGYFREPLQLPNTNEVAPKALVQNLKEMEAAAGVPLVPESDNAAMASGNWGKMRNAWHKAAAFTPMRARFASISQKVREVAGEDFGLAQDYDGLTNQLVMHHNAMNKPVNDLADILAPIDTKRLINGEWMRVWQIGEDEARMAAAQKLGWKPAEVNAMAKFSQLISDVAQEDVNPTLRSYINNVAQKQSVPELFNTAWDEPATANAVQAWREHASTTNINLRELDPRVFGESFIRSVNWQRNMAPSYDAALAKWNEYAKIPGMENTAQFMKNWMGVMKMGYTADDDLALDLVHLAAQKMMGASFTRQQAKELVNFGMNTTHAAFLGYRVHVMARDALQLFFALPRAGPDLAKVIGKYTTDPAYRKMLWDTAMEQGAIQLQMPHRVSPGSLGGELESASVGMAPEHMSKRMQMVGKIGAEVRDWVPDVLKGSSESVLKPLYLYGKQQELMRAMVYRAGFEKADRALLSYRQSLNMDALMGESGARTFDPAWQEEFKRIVSTGDDQKAASFLGRQLADATQFKYGASENPTVGRSLTGKLAMQFGSFQTQYLQYIRESMANGTTGDKAKVALTFLGVTAGLEAASRESGWNFRLMNPFAIGFAGGPAIGMMQGLFQGGSAVGQALFNPEAGGIDRGLQAGSAALGTLGSMMNPVSGLYATATGLGSALNDSPMPGRAVGRLLLTGQQGALPDILQSVHSADLQPAPNPVRQGGWQLPNIPQMVPVYPMGVPTPGNGGYMREPSQIPLGSNPYSGRPLPDQPPTNPWTSFEDSVTSITGRPNAMISDMSNGIGAYAGTHLPGHTADTVWTAPSSVTSPPSLSDRYIAPAPGDEYGHRDLQNIPPQQYSQAHELGHKYFWSHMDDPTVLKYQKTPGGSERFAESFAEAINILRATANGNFQGFGEAMQYAPPVTHELINKLLKEPVFAKHPLNNQGASGAMF